MILAIDCGNTRVKWGVTMGPSLLEPGSTVRWIETGSAPIAELAGMGERWSRLPAPDVIAVSNVAGTAARKFLELALRAYDIQPLWVTAQARQCGVTNSYADPGRLGADRWAALIGARHLHAGDCLVVNAGTATTIDLLSGIGVFLGGVILPGMELMKWALAEKTAGLASAPGEFAEQPRTTADAIETGCVLAQTGAIERLFSRLASGALCLLSGGAAASLAHRVNVPLRVVENLALEGLARIAAERA